MIEKVYVYGKEYTVVKEYPHITLCVDKHGLHTCFDDYDLGRILPKKVDRKPYGE